MEVADLDGRIVDYAASLFLRYFGSIAQIGVHRPSLHLERDRELLQLHWAVSPVVLELAEYVLFHRHEVQSVLDSAIRVEDGIVRGRLDPVASINLRRLSGMSTAVISLEPVRSYASGPNLVLLWVLTHAWKLASRFIGLLPESAPYRASLDKVVRRLSAARRIQPIMKILDQMKAGGRPSANAVLEAGRSRRSLYRKAARAYRCLIRIENGDAEAITEVLGATLLAPLEPWRRYEVVAGYAVGEALAEASQSQLSLGLLVGDNRLPLCSAGRFAVYWQWATGYYRSPPQEPSEVLLQEVLDAYGLSTSSDRPDLVVVDQTARRVVAVIEVKYLSGEDASDRMRAAFGQIVRYARGYSSDDIYPFLGQCLVIVSQGLSKGHKSYSRTTPLVADFEGITLGALQEWACRLSLPAG